MNTTTNKWIEAGKILGQDPMATVRCPVCGLSNLTVEDIPNPNSPVEVERYLRCPFCDAVNIMRIRMSSPAE